MCHKHQTWNLACANCVRAMDKRAAQYAAAQTRELAQVMRQAPAGR